MRFLRHLTALALAVGVIGADGVVAVVQAGPAPQSAAAGDQFKELLAGAWQAQVDDPSGAPIEMTLTINADGTYAQVFAASPSEPAPPAARGAWTVQALSEERFSLTLVRTGQSAANARPLAFRVVDKNTLLNETENYRARRVQ
jgi:uncharacterized lipoprotein NlpE involved in copper resistance